MVVEKSEVPSPKPQFRGEEDEPLPGPGTTETLQGHAYFWGFSEFRFDLYSWIGPAWFSTPGQAGSLSSTGGWGLYALDKIGVLACGDFWPWVGWGVLIVLGTVISLLILYVAVSVRRPVRTLLTCCCRQTRAVATEVGEFLPELRARGTYESLAFRGPSTQSGVDSEFFQRGVKGRGSERKLNDLVVSLDEQIARIKPDGDHWARVDRHGLWVKIREVKGATSRPIRHSLEAESKVHLRREQNCPLELMPAPGIHCKTYAVVDANGLVDLGAYAGWSTRRLVVLFGRCLRRLLSGLHALIYCGSGFFLLKRAWERPAPARVIREGTNVRALDPDSESEMETLEDPCDTVLIGLEVGGRPRALAVDPCADKATGEGVRLLERGRELSDISNRCAAHLCDHHRQLYIAACSGRKCSVLSCHEQVDGAKQGVPLCRKHLMEIGSSARPTRRISWSEGPDDSTPRTPHRDSDVVHQSGSTSPFKKSRERHSQQSARSFSGTSIQPTTST